MADRFLKLLALYSYPFGTIFAIQLPLCELFLFPLLIPMVSLKGLPSPQLNFRYLAVPPPLQAFSKFWFSTNKVVSDMVHTICHVII